MTAATNTTLTTPPSRMRSALRWANSHPVVLFGLLGIPVAGLYLFNLSISPDFTADEVLYSQLSQHIVTFNAISLTGPFLVHPPLGFFFGALWISITGTASGSVLAALTSIRVLSAACCVFTALATGILARDVLSGGTPERRALAGVVATLLVATNGFMLNFGRTALLEPLAIAAGAGIVLAAHRLRERPAVQQVVLLGLLIGVGTLIKQTVLFVALTPLLTGLLMRNRRQVLIGAAAVAVGGAVWSAFPTWAAINGYSGAFWSQQSVSVQRLIGVLHTSGVTLPNGSPLTQFLRTFALYASGYASLIVGMLALVTIAIRRGVMSRSPRLDGSVALMLAYGLISYGFLTYSFAFGAGNQQFMMYSAPASALLCAALFFDRPPTETDGPRWSARPMATGIVIALLLLLGSAGWLRYYAIEPDDGTATIAAYVQANVPDCVPINASGSQPRWEAALPGNPVRFWRNGPDAVRGGVHIFLLSPKDARYGYGNMSHTLADWITTNGRLLVQTPSRSSELLQLWAVGDVPAARTSDCAAGGPVPTTSAPAGEFLVILGAVLFVVLTAGGCGSIAASRRADRSLHSTRSSESGPSGDPGDDTVRG